MKALEQWLRVRVNVRSDVLFVSDGRFLETFAEDAEKVARWLECPIRDYMGTRVVGFPMEVAERKIHMLTFAGKTVAIAEQVRRS